MLAIFTKLHGNARELRGFKPTLLRKRITRALNQHALHGVPRAFAKFIAMRRFEEHSEIDLCISKFAQMRAGFGATKPRFMTKRPCVLREHGRIKHFLSTFVVTEREVRAPKANINRTRDGRACLHDRGCMLKLVTRLVELVQATKRLAAQLIELGELLRRSDSARSRSAFNSAQINEQSIGGDLTTVAGDALLRRACSRPCRVGRGEIWISAKLFDRREQRLWCLLSRLARALQHTCQRVPPHFLSQRFRVLRRCAFAHRSKRFSGATNAHKALRIGDDLRRRHRPTRGLRAVVGVDEPLILGLGRLRASAKIARDRVGLQRAQTRLDFLGSLLKIALNDITQDVGGVIEVITCDEFLGLRERCIEVVHWRVRARVPERGCNATDSNNQ